MKALSLEWYKSRRKGFWLIAFAMAAVVFLWMVIGLRNMDASEKAEGYAYCLYQAALLNAIVQPVFISVLVSRACDMEHKGNALKSLFTMQSRRSLFIAKFVCLAIYLLAAIVLQTLSFLAVGKLFSFTESLRVDMFAVFAFSQWLVSLFIALIIETLALIYVNQFIPLVTGLIGGFLGLMALFFPPIVERFVPSAYYGLLSTVRMDWDSVTRATNMYYVNFSYLDCTLLCIAGVIIFIVALQRFGNKEV